MHDHAALRSVVYASPSPLHRIRTAGLLDVASRRSMPRSRSLRGGMPGLHRSTEVSRAASTLIVDRRGVPLVVSAASEIRHSRLISLLTTISLGLVGLDGIVVALRSFR